MATLRCAAKKLAVCLLLVLPAVASPLFAQSSASHQYSRSQVLLLGATSDVTLSLAAVGGNLLPSPVNAAAVLGLGALSTLPLWFIDLPQGILLTSGSGLAFAAGAFTPASPDLYGDENATPATDAELIGSHLAMWSSYQAYALARMRSPGADSVYHYKNWSFGELFRAPFEGENTSGISFWLPLVGYSLSEAALNLIPTGGSDSVFSTGKAFIGKTEVPILVGLLSTLVLSGFTDDFVAIGEEAVSRDLEYKELTIAVGVVPAKLINAVTFPALHVPQEIAANYDAGTILQDFALRSAATFGLQWAYDQGGLPKAVALHMWIDTAAALIDYLLGSGVPQKVSLSFTLSL